VRNPYSVNAAHVTGRAGRHKHIPGGKGVGGGIQVQEVLLRLKHDPVLGFFIDFDLRMIGTHVALSASTRQARDSHRTGVACMACGAITDGAVAIGFAHAVALLATAGHGGAAFELNKRVRGPARSSGLIGLGKIHLFRSQSLLSINGAPGRSGMAAVQILLVDGFMTCSAISGS